ncbi:hypothetical protein [Actinoplanes sp. HUAS TT8]|uniref:hypothetical protein n=1 Tax=Actinoplanes sp. HUAS TT8 TaxID=3447453 RepID=UPI003F525882
MTITDERLAAVGNVVDAGYRHVTKQVTPGDPLLLPSTILKWYDLCRPDQAIAPERSAEARAFLAGEVGTGRLPIAGDLGFAIHHLSGEHVHLLLVCTWRGDNEMWESVYVKDARKPEPFEPMAPAPHRGVMCVWEFAAVAHEHHAWTRYLLSTRDVTARRTYVESVFQGLI